jgi:hypothetical protein
VFLLSLPLDLHEKTLEAWLVFLLSLPLDLHEKILEATATRRYGKGHQACMRTPPSHCFCEKTYGVAVTGQLWCGASPAGHEGDVLTRA